MCGVHFGEMTNSGQIAKVHSHCSGRSWHYGLTSFSAWPNVKAMFFVIKVTLSALIIAAVSGIAKKSLFLAVILGSLPLNTLLTIGWMKAEQMPNAEIVRFVSGVTLALIPSFAFFLMFPLMVRHGFHFAVSMIASCAATIVAYSLFVYLKI